MVVGDKPPTCLNLTSKGIEGEATKAEKTSSIGDRGSGIGKGEFLPIMNLFIESLSAKS